MTLKMTWVSISPARPGCKAALEMRWSIEAAYKSETVCYRDGSAMDGARSRFDERRVKVGGRGAKALEECA